MRRSLFIPLALVLVAPLLAQTQPQSQPPSQPQPAPAHESAPPRVSPDQIWDALLQGNQLFVAGKLQYDDLKEERALLAGQQMPPVTVLGCADSRVPPELAFNQSLGALFVVRAAGSVADDFGLASIEYAIAQGYTKLIVVLGHENCGAVVASLGGADPSTPALKALATRIRTSFVGIPYDSRDPANVKKAVHANTRSSAAHLLAESILIRDAVLTERVKLVTAYYDMSSGVISKVE